MDSLTDDWPLTVGREMTFVLIDYYLLVLMQN